MRGTNDERSRYRKIQDLDQDDVYRSYITLPLFNDVTKKLCGDARGECDDVVPISVVRTMFFNKPANQGVTIDWQCVACVEHVHCALIH